MLTHDEEKKGTKKSEIVVHRALFIVVIFEYLHRWSHIRLLNTFFNAKKQYYYPSQEHFCAASLVSIAFSYQHDFDGTDDVHGGC